MAVIVDSKMNDLIALCRRRGFIFQSSEIYGGLPGVYDFGPLGVELKNNLKNAWWRSMVYERDDVEGLDTSILTHRLTLQHSGHADTFVDSLRECKKCGNRCLVDELVNEYCNRCGNTDFTAPRNFNLMFSTHIGAVEDNDNCCYLRPETAQGIFTNFKNVVDSTSRRLPFGIAQMGRVFRNEITPRNFIFRVREFEQMELEFFVEPGMDEKWHHIWLEERLNWWLRQGLTRSNLEIYWQKLEELAHYAKQTADILYRFPHGWEELEGISNRSDYDLASHTRGQKEVIIHSSVRENHDSNSKLWMSGDKAGNWFIPYVIEPSAGVERGVLALLQEAFAQEELENGEVRTVLHLRRHLAPVKVAIIPLAHNNDCIMNKCHELRKKLQNLAIGRIRFEDIGNIGKAYRRNDEIGTPICVTVDFETFEDTVDNVTLRDRDTRKQVRISTNELISHVKNYFYSEN